MTTISRVWPTVRPALRSAAAMLLLAAAAAPAQESDTEEYEGRWSAVYQAPDQKPKAAPRRAAILIANFGGYWLDSAASKDTVCSRKKFPITVQVSRPSTFEFTAWGSSIAPSCPDLTIVMKRVDAQTLEGTINGEGELRLTRKR